MKFLVIISCLVMYTHAQRPSYASSGPIGRPGLANRFKDDNDSSSSTVSVENRVGADGSTPKIPVDARGDYDLVNHLSTWEREHQPFWLLNAEQIEKARNTTRGGQITNRDQFSSQNSQGSQTNFQGSQTNFQGSQTNSRGSQTNSRGSETNFPDSQTNFQGSQTNFPESQTNSRGSQTNFQGSQTNSRGSQTNFQGSQTNFPGTQTSQTNRGNQGISQNGIGSSVNSSNSGNRRNPPANRDWMFGRPSQGDIRPIYETPEPTLTDRRMNQAGRQNTSENRPKFHYERNNVQ